jgi:hypothetical protein
MKILYHCQEGGGWDLRQANRDVCVVTRQPLLKSLIDQGHEIVFWKQPNAIADADKQKMSAECTGELEKASYSANETASAFLAGHIKCLDDPYSYEDEDFDFAISEVRSRLYFHDKMPLDTKFQYELWSSGLPTMVWDKDLWFAENYRYYLEHYDTKDKNIHVITPSLNPAASSDLFDYDVKWTHFDFAFSPNEKAEPNPNPSIEFGYLGSEYNRQDEFHKYVTTASKFYKTEIFGQFYANTMERTPLAKFHGRTPMFRGVQHLNDMRATIHIVPKYYQYAGHMTYRIWESPMAGTALLADGQIRGIEDYVIKENIVHDIPEFLARMDDIKLMGAGERSALIKKQIRKLNYETFDDRATELKKIYQKAFI